MSEVPPGLLAAAEQEIVNLRGWLTMLADSWPEAVSATSEIAALTSLARHIETHTYSNVPDHPPTGWMVAAVAVTLVSRLRHPMPELPPLISQDDPQFVPKVVAGLLDPANRAPLQVDGLELHILQIGSRLALCQQQGGQGADSPSAATCMDCRRIYEASGDSATFRAVPTPRYTDARGECSCHINPPCGWCSGHCCADHVDHCLAGFPPPCCERCPDDN